MVNGNLALQRAPGMDTPGYIRYFGAAAWGICIMVSMVGWGAVMRRVTAPAQKSPGDWGQLACIGFSLTTVVGGILNFFALISRLSVISYVVLGVVAFSYSPSRDLIRFPAPGGDGRFSAYPWFAKALLLLAGLLLCVRFFGAVVTTEAPNTVYPAINPYDDLQGYLVFPEKMIQTGAMGVDPFSLRRTPTHTLGGSPFLKSLIVAAFPEENVPLLDAGLGPVLVVGVLLGYLAQMAASPLATGIVLLTFLLIPAPTWNTTPMVIPMALILSLFRIQTEAFTAQNRLSGPVLIGLHVAALASLKSSLIPAAVALAAVNYLLISATAGNRGEAIRRAAVVPVMRSISLAVDRRHVSDDGQPVSRVSRHLSRKSGVRPNVERAYRLAVVFLPYQSFSPDSVSGHCGPPCDHGGRKGKAENGATGNCIVGGGGTAGRGRRGRGHGRFQPDIPLCTGRCRSRRPGRGCPVCGWCRAQAIQW
jgi:hypothetical protein